MMTTTYRGSYVVNENDDIDDDVEGSVYDDRPLLTRMVQVMATMW